MWLTLLLVLLAAYLYYRHKFNYWTKRGIGGPRPYPVIGTLIAEQRLPAKEIEQCFLKEYGRVFGTWFGSKPVLNTSVPAHIEEILKNPNTFSNITSIHFNDRYWKEGRKVQNPFFLQGSSLRKHMASFEAIADNFIENIGIIRRKTGSDDIDAKICKYYAVDCISKAIFSLEKDSYKERDTLFVKAAISIGDIDFKGAILCTILPKKLCQFFNVQPFQSWPINTLARFFKNLLDIRKKNGLEYGDFSELLQKAVNDKKVTMSENDVIGIILIVFFAGTEPVSNTLANVFYFLSENPAVQQKLYNEIAENFSDKIEYQALRQNEYLNAVVNETLRMGNSILFLTRSAAENTKLGEIEIEAGTEIRLIHDLSNFNPEFWSNPLVFNPDRFVGDTDESKDKFFIPFGMGNKCCPGQRMAQLMIKYLLVRLLARYELVPPKTPDRKVNSIRGFLNTVKLNVGFRERDK